MFDSLKQWFDGVMLHQYVMFYPLIGWVAFMLLLLIVLPSVDAWKRRRKPVKATRPVKTITKACISERNTARIAQARQQRLTERAERFRALHKEK